MGYEIYYGQKKDNTSNINKSRKKVKIALLLATAFASYLLYKQGTWKEFLIPGEAAITQAAFNTLSENLRDGLPVKEALSEFYLDLHSYETFH